MTNDICFLLTLYYPEGDDTLIKAVLKIDKDLLPPDVLKYPMGLTSRAYLRSKLSEHVQRCGYIVAVEEIFNVDVIK